jgi:hypothetical protein
MFRAFSTYRWARILIHELIWLNISKVPRYSSETSNQQSSSLATISEMARDIFCSVNLEFRHTNPVEARGRKPGSSGAGSIILFPLAVAGGAVGVSDEVHEWAMQILADIEHEKGSE